MQDKTVSLKMGGQLCFTGNPPNVVYFKYLNPAMLLDIFCYL